MSIRTIAAVTQTLHGLGNTPRHVATVTMKGGRQHWLAADWEELESAVASGEPFSVTQIIALEPVPMIVNPAQIATIELQAD